MWEIQITGYMLKRSADQAGNRHKLAAKMDFYCRQRRILSPAVTNGDLVWEQSLSKLTVVIAVSSLSEGLVWSTRLDPRPHPSPWEKN
ncbi:hypothetical protein WN943_020664 [Citrus x changshan-huyou]